MSLRFVIGRSGTGKTALFLDEIAEKLKQEPNGRPILYIVPEQMTFLSEYKMVHKPGITGMIRSQVYSFTRLAWRIIQEAGGSSRFHVTSAGVNMLIRKIIEDRKEDLRLFGRAADKSGFVTHVESMLNEFKHYCISPEELSARQEELKKEEGSRALADKLHDLKLIYDGFEEALSGKYLDSADYLTLLAESIERSDYLRDSEIYIDGFYSFTPQEQLVIAGLIKSCSRVSVALTLDRPCRGVAPDDLDLFRLTGETYASLYSMASEMRAEVEEDVILLRTRRYGDDSLYHLEEAFEKRPPLPYSGSPQIEVWRAANRRAEIEGIAREIRRLAQEEGMRYRDIAVLVRNSRDYADIIDTVFYDYDIPYFSDQKTPMLNHPLIELVRSTIEIVISNWRYDPVFRAAKTDLLFPAEANKKAYREMLDRLENYVLAYGKKGSQWTGGETWIYKRFQGLDMPRTAQTDAEIEKEQEINAMRLMISEPVHRLEKRLKKARTARQLCEAVYLYLEELDVPAKLEILHKEAEEKGLLVLAGQHDQAWNALTELLDQCVEVLDEEELSLARFAAVLDAGIESMRFALIPPAIDQVSVANLDTSRLDQIQACFVVGMNEGVLPARMAEDGVLSDADRGKLIESGFKIGISNGLKLLDEEFVAYRAFSISSQKLYVVYPMADEEGKSLLPSPFLKRLKELFPNIAEKSIVQEPAELPAEEQQAYISHPAPTLAYLAAQLQMKKQGYPVANFWWDVYNYYIESPLWRDRADKVLSSLFYKNTAGRLSEETGKQLYGEEILASVSRMELFHSCPFSHFASHGLKLRERDIYRLEAPHIGELFHGALKWIGDEVNKRSISWAELSKDQCDHLARQAVESLAPRLQHQILLSSNRHHYIKRKLEQVISRASRVLSRQAQSSGFSPVGLELGFGPRQELPPFAFTLKNGTRMALQGRIDRVDKAQDENGVYLRVIDYKSSGRELDLNEVYYGLALQMLTYLDIIVTHSKKLVGTEASPAGVLYFHMHNPMIQTTKILTLDEIEEEILKQFKMKGLMMQSPEIIRLMDTGLETGKSNIVAAEFKKDGTLSPRSQTATPDDFSALKNYVRKLYQKAGDSIVSGNVEISPYKLKDRTPCQFCSFRPVCQFDQSLENNEYRIIRPEQPEIVIDRIRMEE